MFIDEGWFDHHLGSALTGYAALNEQVKEHSWLRIGCWNHYFLNPLEGLEPSISTPPKCRPRSNGST